MLCSRFPKELGLPVASVAWRQKRRNFLCILGEKRRARGVREKINVCKHTIV